MCDLVIGVVKYDPFSKALQGCGELAGALLGFMFGRSQVIGQLFGFRDILDCCYRT